MDTLTFWEMHLSDVLLGVSSLMSVWSSGENRATETEARGAGDIEAMGNSYLPKSITANRLVSYSSRYHLGFDRPGEGFEGLSRDFKRVRKCERLPAS